MVQERQHIYFAAKKLDKAKVAMVLVEEIKAAGGRFLVERDGRWIEVSAEKARTKASQAFRENQKRKTA
jgi:hypothetical protein